MQPEPLTALTCSKEKYACNTLRMMWLLGDSSEQLHKGYNLSCIMAGSLRPGIIQPVARFAKIFCHCHPKTFCSLADLKHKLSESLLVCSVLVAGTTAVLTVKIYDSDWRTIENRASGCHKWLKTGCCPRLWLQVWIPEGFPGFQTLPHTCRVAGIICLLF